MYTGISTTLSDFIFLLMMFPLLFCLHYLLNHFVPSEQFFDFILHPNCVLYVALVMVFDYVLSMVIMVFSTKQ